MTEIQKLYMQEFVPDPITLLDDVELIRIKNNRYMTREDRKNASRELIRREELNIRRSK